MWQEAGIYSDWLLAQTLSEHSLVNYKIPVKILVDDNQVIWWEKLKSKKKKKKNNWDWYWIANVHDLLLNQEALKKRAILNYVFLGMTLMAVRMESWFFNPAISLACQTHRFLIHLDWNNPSQCRLPQKYLAQKTDLVLTQNITWAQKASMLQERGLMAASGVRAASWTKLENSRDVLHWALPTAMARQRKLNSAGSYREML